MNEFQQAEQPVVYNSAKWIARTAGWAAAVLGTPAVYEVTRQPLFKYLTRTYGRDIAEWVTLAGGVAEAVVIGFAVVGLVHYGLTWGLAWLAARGLGR